MYHYVLFDLDGTLTDPKEGICKSVQYALQCAGIDPPPVDELTGFIGPPLADSFRGFYGMDEQAVGKAVADYRKRFADVGWKENIPYEGIAEVLRHCKESGVFLAVASSKPQVFVDRILEYFSLKEYFDVVVGSGLDGSLGTKEEVVRKALQLLYERKGPGETEAEKKAATAMVGDRKYDIEGARAEGIDAIGVSYGYQQPGELAAAGADAIACDRKELEELLLGGRGSDTGTAKETLTGKKAAKEKRPKPRTPEKAARKRPQRTVTPRKVPELSMARALYILTPLFFYYLFRIGMLGVLQSGLELAGKGDLSAAGGTTADYTWPVAAMTGLTALGLWLIYRNSEPMRGDPARDGRAGAREYILSAGIGMLLALGLNILSAFLVGHMSDSVRDSLNIPGSPETTDFFAGFILYGLLSPLTEELLFRWLLLNRIERVFNTRMAVALSALFFGIYHGNVVQGCYAFLMGAVLAVICVRTKSLTAAYLFHAVANIVIYSSAFLPAGILAMAMSVPMGLLYLAAGIAGLTVLMRTKKTAAPEGGGRKTAPEKEGSRRIP